MDSDLTAVCIKAIVDKYADKPEDMVEALESFMNCIEDNSKILERIETLEKDSHEQEMLSPERWQEMIKEIRKSIDPDYEEESPIVKKLKEAIKKTSPFLPVPGPILPEPYVVPGPWVAPPLPPNWTPGLPSSAPNTAGDFTIWHRGSTCENAVIC